MTKHTVLTKLKTAFLAGSFCVLSACANNATSNLAERALDAADSPMTLVGLGQAAAARGDHASAIQYFRSAHAKNLAYSSAKGAPLLGLGQSLLAIGENTDAANVFIKAAKAGAGAPALRGLAQAQLYIRQPGLAVESARRALQLDPGDVKSMAILGIAMDVMGDHQGAAAIYTDAMLQFPGSLALASNHGLSMVMTGDMDTGIRLLEDVVRDPRATARDRQNLALAYALGGDYDKAAAMAAIDLDVSGVRANLLYADMLRAMSPRARLTALVTGSQASKTDISQNANAVYLQGDNAAWVEASIRRLVPIEGSADLAGVPPLMDPTGWAVQVAAYRKLEHLAPGWAYLSSKYAGILGGLEPRRSEVNHPPAAKGPVGFFYRLNAGPLRDKQEAMDICARLKARGAECWVRPPTAGEGRLPSDEMVRSRAAESAFVASSDYNAVVNQFARSMVMKSRKDLPAKTRPLPPVMLADAPKEAPTATADESDIDDNQERAVPAAETIADTNVPEGTPAEAAPKVEETVKADAAPADVSDTETKDVAEAQKPKPAIADNAAKPTDAPAPEEQRVKAVQSEVPSRPDEAAPQEAAQTLAAVAPSAAGRTEPEEEDSQEEEEADTLMGVFDALDEADTVSQTKPVRPPIAPARVQTIGAAASQKRIPALKRFNDTPKNLRYMDQSGTVQPKFEQAGNVKESAKEVSGGVY